MGVGERVQGRHPCLLPRKEKEAGDRSGVDVYLASPGRTKASSSSCDVINPSRRINCTNHFGLR